VETETPETHPDLFIAVHTPEVCSVLSGGTYFDVRTDNTIISYRRRTEEDGDLAFAEAPPKLKHQRDLEKERAAMHESRRQWASRFLNGELSGIDPQRYQFGTGQHHPPSSDSTEWTHRRRSTFSGWRKD
jgi:hypothetical protein